MRGISAMKLFEDKVVDLDLEMVTEIEKARLPITVSDVNRPGLALAGFTENFLFERIQILGETEMLYMGTLSPEKQEEAYDHLFEQDLPCVILSKGLPVPDPLLARCIKGSVPLLRTKLSTTPFIHLLTAYLNEVFAPRMTLHGSLVDVYGVGLLLTGESGIGKSETALDLVERGHRLVADDIVIVSRRPPAVLVGSSNELLGHRMEIRGVGIVDVRRMFGIRATRMRKRIEVEVRLEHWDPEERYERLGLDDRTTSILGVRVSHVTIPLIPGKNVSVLAEVVAMNHLIRSGGHSPAADLDARLRLLMEEQRTAAEVGDAGDTE
ncbi:MAG: HPr(Ser) kinase/phosphatase [Gemmatimonadota bacterium]|jgi:HPr kinase/phosphorylase|nr:HPr(Ser) kinase/phosphatase [Gemmatimonadota bacterium]MDP6802275.1 HPr(Ser) kinase/phosphatase [Gemmatimonadota bacterium]